MRRWILTAAAVAVLGGALAACETATPYQPMQEGAQATVGGYAETRIEDDRWRVTFKGNDETPRGVVETYMLYRAAELTLAQGYDWFEAAQRHTDTHTSGYGTVWGPSWGWRRWGSWGGTFWDQDVAFDTEQHYDASIEIVLRRGAKPSDDPHAFDARQVVANLGPKIVRPGSPQ